MRKLAEHEAAHAGSAHQSSALDEATPHLDDALAELADADRDAVLLHFYDGLPYREIGLRIDRGEDAARKRVNKALERMSDFLRRRGVTLTGTALAGGLTAQLTSTAHGATVSAVSKGALELVANSAVPATVAATPFIKWAIAGTAVLAISTGAGYVTANRSDEPPPVTKTLTPTNNSSPTALTKQRPAYEVLSPEVAARLRDPVAQRLQLAVDLWDEQGQRRSAAYERKRVMESFTADEAKEALVLMDRDHAYNRDRHMRMSGELIETIMRGEPVDGAAYAMERYRSGDPNWQGNSRLHKVVDAWADSDPAATREWLAGQDLPDPLRSQFVANLMRTTSWKNPESALELLLELPDHKRRNSYGSFQSYEYPELRERTLEAVATLPDEAERAAIFHNSIARKVEAYADVRVAFDRMNFSRSDAVVPALNEILYRAFNHDPDGLPKFFDLAFDSAPEAAHAHFLDRYGTKWLESDPGAATAWLESRGLTTDDVADATASIQ